MNSEKLKQVIDSIDHLLDLKQQALAKLKQVRWTLLLEHALSAKGMALKDVASIIRAKNYPIGASVSSTVQHLSRKMECKVNLNDIVAVTTKDGETVTLQKPIPN